MLYVSNTMIKILVQEPSAGGVDATPFEILVPAVPRRGDSFDVRGGFYTVMHVSFKQMQNGSVSVLVFLGENKLANE